MGFVISERRGRRQRRSIIGAVVSCSALVSGAIAGPSFPYEEFRDRLPWIWERPERSEAPAVADPSWPRDEIDAFILSRLEAEGMAPAPDADPVVWWRRVHFVITGLPPKPGDTQAFLADPSEEARREWVRRLLASPHFGERWARHWMDLVRYAESRGHESDFIVANAWRYRDYLVRAFNADLPYDRLVIEHLAGDIVSPPRTDPETGANESVLATGWPFFGEEVHSPVDIRQDECDRNDNKIDVLSKTFLGLTVSCARCHDHKFDAIGIRDYYGLAGFILSSSYRQVRFESEEQNRQIAGELAALRETSNREARAAMADALRPVIEAMDSSEAATVAGPLSIDLPSDAEVVADFTNPGRSPWLVDGFVFGREPVRAGTVAIDGIEGRIRAHPWGAAVRDPFWNRLAIAEGNEGDSGTLDAVSRAGRMIRTPTVTLRTGRLHYLIRGKAKVYAAVSRHLMITGPLHGDLVREFDVADDQPRWVTHDLSRYAGLRAHVEFGPVGDAPLEVLMAVDAPEPPKVDRPMITVGLDDLREGAAMLASGESPARPEVAVALVAALHQSTASAGGQPAVPGCGPRFAEQCRALGEKVRWESHTAVAWFDGSAVEEYVLDRGSPLSPGESAPRGLPTAMGSRFVDSARSGRLELARAIASPDNPLTARVMVNRVWHHVFGQGIVPTVDNFGWLGERPSHPGLLDSLARDFTERHGWSIKALVERLVMTRTFGMASVAADPSHDERDPTNRLLHRMPVRRLEAEAIRDSILAVSGRLDPAVGGPPVPVHLTDFVVGRGRPGESGPLDGAGRRSIYTALRRNFLPTFMLAFDFPTPFTTVGRRNVTNVPAQSLALMNDPFVHEQARFWAERTLREASDASAEDRIERLFLEAFARRPTAYESARCLESLAELRAAHGCGPDALEAWSDLCHALLGMHDLIYLR